MRKHVHRLNFKHFIVLAHEAQVPCQGGGVAGDVDEAPGAKPAELREELRAAALARGTDK